MEKYKNRDWLYQQFIKKEKSSNEIGKMVGLTGSIIRYWLKKYNLKCTQRKPKTCIVCNEKYIQQPKTANQRFCSKECSMKYWSAHQYKNKRIEKNCIVCNKRIEFGSKRSKYCSKKCATIAKQKRTTKRRNEKFNSYKLKKGCLICRYNKIPDVLDFHHKYKKNFKITKSNFYTMNQELKEELKKCVILCKKCHHELHYIKRRILNPLMAYHLAKTLSNH